MTNRAARISLWINVVIALLTLATIWAAIHAAKMANVGAETIDKRAATRSACTEFAVARMSLSFTAGELMRVLKEFSAQSLQEVPEKRKAFEDANGMYQRAIAELQFIAESDLEGVAADFHERFEAAIKALRSYYARLAEDLEARRKPTSEPPLHTWSAMEAEAERVITACKLQAKSGSLGLF